MFIVCMITLCIRSINQLVNSDTFSWTMITNQQSHPASYNTQYKHHHMYMSTQMIITTERVLTDEF